MSGLQRGQRAWGFLRPMIWINIKTTTLRESEYISASPTQQATWLKLLAYCSEHENGGVIHGAGGWNERAWLFGCGITLDEVRDQCGLWSFDGTGSLTVWNYPVEKELEVVAKREAGKRGGQAKAQNRSTACSSATAQPVAQLVAKPDSACSSPPTEGVRSKVEGEGVNGREKEGPKERELELEDESATPPAPAPEKPKRQKFIKPTLDEWTAYAKTMPEPLAENQALGAWDYYEGNGWRVGRNPMADWKATLRAWARRQKDFAPARSGKMSYEEEERIHKPNPNSEYGF